MGGSGAIAAYWKQRRRSARRCSRLWCCMFMGFGAANGLQAFIVSTRTTSTRTVNSNKGMPTGPFKRDVKYTKQTTAAVGLLAAYDPWAFEDGSGLGGDEEGTDLMSQLMGEVNRRENLQRKVGVRLLKRPSALIPPHAVLEHVMGSLRTPDYPTDGAGMQQAFLFSALDHEVSRGPIDYRRDWSDKDESQPRYLDRKSHAAVMEKGFGFLLGLADFSVNGSPMFSEDDHRVTFPVRVIPNEHSSAQKWVEVEFLLGRVREGSHKDCWLVERVIVRSWEGIPSAQGF